MSSNRRYMTAEQEGIGYFLGSLIAKNSNFKRLLYIHKRLAKGDYVSFDDIVEMYNDSVDYQSTPIKQWKSYYKKQIEDYAINKIDEKISVLKGWLEIPECIDRDSELYDTATYYIDIEEKLTRYYERICSLSSELIASKKEVKLLLSDQTKLKRAIATLAR